MPRQLVSGNKFRAVTYTMPSSLDIPEVSYEPREDVEFPQIISSGKVLIPGREDILKNFVTIQVEGCGICGTDIHMYSGKRFLDEKPENSNPLIPGHEIFGKVTFAQGEFEHLIGKDVVIDPIIDCYGGKRCYFCSINKNYMHTPFREMGICGNVPGGFAEYSMGLAKNCFEVENLSYKQKVLIEPLATLIYAFKYLMKLLSRQSIFLIIGAGTAGLLAIQYLKKLNNNNYIVMIDKNSFRLNIAKSLGANVILCTEGLHKTEIIKNALRSADKQGFRYILELSGGDDVVNFLPHMASRLSNILLYGLGHTKVCIENFDLIIEKEIRFYPSLGASDRRSFNDAIEVMPGFKIEEIVTNECRGLEAIERVVKDDYFNKGYIKGLVLI